MKTILVADDNSLSRELIFEGLEGCGFTVIEAADGREALSQMRRYRPDLVLLDIQMPELDGYAVLREIRADSEMESVPVIAVTAFAMEGDRAKALCAGFNACITKPIHVSALRQEINRLLQMPEPNRPGADA